MKRILGCWVLLVTLSCFVLANHDQAEVHDEYAEVFVQSMAHDKVVYDDGDVKIYAKWSLLDTAACVGFGAFTSASFFGAGMGLFGGIQSGHPEALTAACLGATALVGLGALSIYGIVRKIKNHNNQEWPLFLFTSDGFVYDNGRFIRWDEVKTADVVTSAYVQNSTAVSTGGSHFAMSDGIGIAYPIHKFIVSDRFDSELFSLSEYNMRNPITFKNFVAIFKHFHEKSREMNNASK